jgi:hypothetical protein
LRLRSLVLKLAVAGAIIAASAHAQSAQSTASKIFDLSTFAGLNGTYTGLSGGRNLGITAGVDVGLQPFHGYRPFLEGRGTYPVHGGHIASEKNALGGIRVERFVVPGLRLYGDFLLGRGQIDYKNGGYPSARGNFRILSSTSNVYSPGIGAEFSITHDLSGLVDAQFQHYSTPATRSGSLWSRPIMFGVRYRVDFNRRGYASAP